jgi:glucokinase
VVDLKGSLLDSVRTIPPVGTPEDVFGFLAAAAEERVRALGLPPRDLVGVGVSVPGVVDSTRGELRLSPFFHWTDVAVRPKFEARFGRRVTVANPLQAIAVAEMLFGSAARAARADLVLVNVSTAIAGAFVLGGQLQHGADDASGQIGHITVDASGRRCGCGRRGCLDALAAGDALVSIGAEAGQRYVSFSDLLLAAERGQEAALELLDESARLVGRVVGDLITVLNPAVVAVSGMVLQLGEGYVNRVRRAALERAWITAEAAPRIVPSAFGINAGVVGSAAIALDRFVYGAGSAAARA